MKDKHTYGKKIARKGHTKVIYKGTFISERSLDTFWQGIVKENANMVTQSFCFIIFGENL